MATLTEQALIDAPIFGDPIAGLPNVDITPGYNNYMTRLGRTERGQFVTDVAGDVLTGRPDIGVGSQLLPFSPHKAGYRYKTLPNKLEDYIPGWAPGFIRNPLTKLSDALYEDALKPRHIKEYREGDPTWIQDWNPYWKPDWDYSNLPPDVLTTGEPVSSRGGYSGLIRPVGAIGPALASTDMMPYVSDVDTQRGGYRRWSDLAKRFSPISTAEADIFRSPRVAIEPTPDTTVRDLLEDARTETGDTAINRLMDFREPRIRFSLPAGARGPRPADPVPYILDDQPDPYTSITTLPIGEEGWTPTLLSDTLGGPVTDQPRTNLDGTMTYLTNEEAMVSDVQRALDRAGRIGPAPPVTSVESQLQALAELSQTDPTIAERYTTPDSQDLIDIKSQVDSFSALQEADQQRMEREAKQEAARQEQVRADNERRAEEAREEQDRARENRERQEAQAERAKAIAKRSKAADDRKAAARAQARADAAAQRERQATIQRQEDNRRRQATERAAKQAEQARKAAIAAAKPTPVRRRRGGRPASRRVWKQPSRGRGR